MDTNGLGWIGREQWDLRRHDLRHHSCFLLYERGIWALFCFPVSNRHSLQIGYQLVCLFLFCIKSAINHVFVLYQSLFFLSLFHGLDTKTRILISYLEYQIAIQSTQFTHPLRLLYHLLVPIRCTLDIIPWQIKCLVCHSQPPCFSRALINLIPWPNSAHTHTPLFTAPMGWDGADLIDVVTHP
ncbi:hypothetical protein HDV62DRAFT_43952 [Trichoderma sp. SZMC 28011]